jgi:hypothetical protein
LFFDLLSEAMMLPRSKRITWGQLFIFGVSSLGTDTRRLIMTSSDICPSPLELLRRNAKFYPIWKVNPRVQNSSRKVYFSSAVGQTPRMKV